MERTYGYGQMLADIYEHSPFLARGSAERVKFYVEEARNRGGPVLELGAATGLYTIPLARAGLLVHAVDISPDMLEVIRQRLQAEPPEIRERVILQQRDMRFLSIPERFRTALMPGNVLLAATSIEDQVRVLRSVERHLEPGGYLILDVFSPDRTLIERKTDYSWCQFTVPGSDYVFFCHRYCNVEPFQQLLRIRFIHEKIEPDGTLSERRLDTIEFRYLYPTELTLLLRLTGFAVKHLYGDFTTKRTKSLYDGHQIVIAQKRS